MSIWGKLADVAAELVGGGPIGSLRSGVGIKSRTGRLKTRWRSPLA